MSGEAAQKRWMNLRDAFNNYHKKMKGHKSGDENRKIKKYRYADVLQFLLPFLKQRETCGNLEESRSVDHLPSDTQSTSAELDMALEEACGGTSPIHSPCILSPKVPTRKRKEQNLETDHPRIF
ncbi:uncharacterized protein [Apostichopus japonicus]|uniref:uncharacterized protein n=1 Tax=Stichopus japonicus TaxID=307972 RepID=UPI003AB80CDD